MQLNAIRERAERELTPIIENLGYEVVEISFLKKNSGFILTVFIHKPGGVSLKDCEIVNEALDQPLETLDLTGDIPYTFNVSSPGLDRPIKSMKDYERNLGIRVDVTFIENVDKKKKLSGILKSHNESSCELDVKGKKYILEKNNIKLMLPYIDLKGISWEVIEGNDK
ncbi:MAG: ribosome maturation factor RimP [Christensenellaceae bacterium]|jgi:ribosome maturation factor RimP|nr:ribosome maturation factor RimP [Christensenellaceae bacterium]